MNSLFSKLPQPDVVQLLNDAISEKEAKIQEIISQINKLEEEIPKLEIQKWAKYDAEKKDELEIKITNSLEKLEDLGKEEITLQREIDKLNFVRDNELSDLIQTIKTLSIEMKEAVSKGHNSIFN